MLLKFQAFWDVILYQWVSSCWHFEETQCLQNVREHPVTH